MDSNKNKELDKTKDSTTPKTSPEREVGGYKGQNPTEHGDWQHKGRTTDF